MKRIQRNAVVPLNPLHTQLHPLKSRKGMPMFLTTASTRLAAYVRQLPVRWTTVAALAIVIAYSDGFWLTALQGAIGAVELDEPPFMHWLRDATLMLPLVFLAVLVGLLGARRWFARRRWLVGRGAAALLIALVSGGVGIAAAGANSLRDYQYQIQHHELLHSYGAATQPGAAGASGFGPVAPAAYELYCNLRGAVTVRPDGSAVVGDSVTLLEYETLMLHVRALAIAALILLSTNLVLAAGLVALLKDRLWATRLVASPQSNETTGPLATGGALL
jgi:hypothetical protein